MVDFKFFCSSCDRGFKSAEMFAAHNAEHEICGREGCRFTAHPKVVAKHVEMQHETGLFRKIGNLYTPEAIAQWIDERKRNFPTRENIERKRLEMKEKFMRGERLTGIKKRFGDLPPRGQKASNRKGGRASRRYDNFSSKNNYDKKRTFLKVQEAEKEEQKPKMRQSGVMPFPDSVTINDYDENELPHRPHPSPPASRDDFSDGEWDAPSSSQATSVPRTAFSNVLSSLAANYGSDVSSSEDESAAAVVPKQPAAHTSVQSASFAASPKTNVVNLPAKTVMDCKEQSQLKSSEFNSDDEAPEEIPISRKDMVPNNETYPKGQYHQEDETDINGSRKRRRHHRGKRNFEPRSSTAHRPMRSFVHKQAVQRLQRPRKSTLLEKLLSCEILHERNVILQCVRFVVQNKFFGIDQSPSSATSDHSLKILKQCIHFITKNNFFDKPDSGVSSETLVICDTNMV